jgi:hypothetical protein
VNHDSGSSRSSAVIEGDSYLHHQDRKPRYSCGGILMSREKALDWLWNTYGNVTAQVINATCMSDDRDVFFLIAIEKNSEDAA